MPRVFEIEWVEAAMVQPGMVQNGCGNPERDRIVGSVYDGVSVVVEYADGTTQAYAAWRDLPILRGVS